MGTLVSRSNPASPNHDREMTEKMFTTLMREKGEYSTGYVGKWGLGTTQGAPWNQGFNYFFGQLTHFDAHMKFPQRMTEFKDSKRTIHLIPENDPSHVKDGEWNEHTCPLNPHASCIYVNDIFRDKAMNFIRTAKEPFFLTWAPTHAHSGTYNSWEIKQTSPVKHMTRWRVGTDNQDIRGHASEIEQHLEVDVTTLLEYLHENPDLDERTLVVLTSDNGPANDEPGYTPEFFLGSNGLRGWKRSMYQGGYHIPTIIRWKGTIKENHVLMAPHALYDLAWTFLDVAGVDPTLQQSLGKGGSIGGGKSLLQWWIANDDKMAPRRDWLHMELCGLQRDEVCWDSTIDIRNWSDPNKPVWKLLVKSRNYELATELFDLRSDHLETKQILNNAHVVTELLSMRAAAREFYSVAV